MFYCSCLHVLVKPVYSHVLGEQMREAVYINQGLFALKNCIRKLNEREDYIPYQVGSVVVARTDAVIRGRLRCSCSQARADHTCARAHSITLNTTRIGFQAHAAAGSRARR